MIMTKLCMVLHIYHVRSRANHRYFPVQSVALSVVWQNVKWKHKHTLLIRTNKSINTTPTNRWWLFLFCVWILVARFTLFWLRIVHYTYALYIVRCVFVVFYFAREAKLWTTANNGIGNKQFIFMWLRLNSARTNNMCPSNNDGLFRIVESQFSREKTQHEKK